MGYLIGAVVGLSALIVIFGVLAIISDFVVNPRGREDGRHTVLKVGIVCTLAGCAGLLTAFAAGSV